MAQLHACAPSPAHSPSQTTEPSLQDNLNSNPKIAIFKLPKQAATGFSRALDVVLDINSATPAVTELEHAHD